MTILKKLAILGGATVFAVAAMPGMAQNLNLHTFAGRNSAVIGPVPHLLAERVETFTGGEVKIKVFDPGDLVPAIQYYDAVSQGSVDAAFGAAGFEVSKNSAYDFVSAIPFGPQAPEYYAWIFNGGGLELAQELYARDNIYWYPCGNVVAETGGWFKQPLSGVGDLAGLSMRFAGLGSKVFTKLGVSTQLMGGGEIYQAIELGTIDAAELSFPANDRSAGLPEVVKHNYFPGWHQQQAINELLVNLTAWNGLSDGAKEAIHVSCKAAILETMAEGEATQFAALEQHVADGVTLHTYPQEWLDTFHATWLEVVEEEKAANPDWARMWDSFSEFRSRYKLWADRAYLPRN
ncbi:TRAP-type mannitol/chloroaromatic compound transport system substrate-binding protein [Roseovarius sp. MBR-154]|jgi:TRAP-type mannitol/chloroaromatic compound transport system substrate-binding protein